MKASNDYRVYAETERREMLPFVPVGARRILDVGCSVGNFGAILKVERGAEVWGMEADEEAARLAARKLDRVINAPFGPGQELEGELFDCIVYNDVLEHMVDPYSALGYARELLAPEGRVVASIPNVRYFANVWNLVVRGQWEYEDSGILDRTHLRFFTQKSIRSMFEEHGYEVEVLKGINPVEMAGRRNALKFRLMNIATLGRIADMRWLQFAVVARL